jgi:Spy/CpxP family protein refolding chaperone
MRCFKAALAISALVLTAACSHVHFADVAYAPNPPPPPGYKAVCSSTGLPLNAFITSCVPAAGEQVVAVRAKG